MVEITPKLAPFYNRNRQLQIEYFGRPGISIDQLGDKTGARWEAWKFKATRYCLTGSFVFLIAGGRAARRLFWPQPLIARGRICDKTARAE
jgi:hypothetical protein